MARSRSSTRTGRPLPSASWAERSWSHALVILFLLAVGLRLAVFLQGGVLPHISTPILDARYYLEQAHAIAHGGGLGPEPFFMNPGYVLLVGAFDWIFASPTAPLVLFQILLDGLGCVLTAVLARRLFGAGAGLVAGALVAINGAGIVAATSILPEPAAAFLMVVLGLVVTRGPAAFSTRNLLAAGAVLGALCLLRSNALLIFPLLLLGLRLQEPRPGWGVWVSRSGLVLVGGAAVVAPITLCNAVIGNDFVLISSSGGINFYLGNSSESDGRFLSLQKLAWAPGRLQDDPTGGALAKSITVLAEEQRGRRLRPSEVSSFWAERALGEISADPGRWLALLGRKVFLYFDHFEFPQVENLYYLAGHLPVLRGPATWASRLLWPLGVFGIVTFLARPRGAALAAPTSAGLVLWIFAGYAGSVVLFFVTARHRLPAVPLLACFAGGGASCLVGLFRTGHPRRLPCSVLLVVCLLLSNLNPALGQPRPAGVKRAWFRADPGYYDLAMQHSNTCALLLEQGDWASAEAECRRGLAASPAHASLLYNLGRALEKKGDPSGAREAMGRSLELAPDNAAVAAHYGTLAYRLGDAETARRALERAVALSPDLASAWNSLGPLRFQRGDAEGALAALLEAERLSPGWHVPLVNRAIVLIRLGRFDEAAALLASLREGEPESREITLALVEALTGAGRTAEAEALLEGHLSRSPEDVEGAILRAQLQLAKGEDELARQTLLRLLATHPGDRRARSLLRKIDREDTAWK